MRDTSSHKNLKLQFLRRGDMQNLDDSSPQTVDIVAALNLLQDGLGHATKTFRQQLAQRSAQCLELALHPSFFPDRFGNRLAHEAYLLLPVDIRLCRLGRR